MTRYAELPALDLIAISGPDRRKFLQGQVTCDMDLLAPVHSLRGAVCNIKGRVVADFRAVERDDLILLQLAAGMGPVLTAALKKYMVFFKTQWTPSADLRRFGVWGTDVQAALTAWRPDIPLPQTPDAVTAIDGTVIIQSGHLDGISRLELWMPEAVATEFQAWAALHLTSGTVSDWSLQDLRLGIAHVSPDFSEQYLPQELNYDINGVVNFKKGCYTGQEIVARMFYRGQAKKRLLCLGRAAWTDSLPSQIWVRPQDVATEGTACPVVAAQLSATGELLLLAVAPVGVVGGTELAFADPADPQPLQVYPLPYWP